MLSSPLSWLALLAIPGWKEFEAKLPTELAPVYYDTAALPASAVGKPILFRDIEGLSPSAQQVWLALEFKEADYVTVLTTNKHSNPTNIEEQEAIAMPMLKVQWPDGTIQTDSFAILERINDNYSLNGYNTQDLFQGVSQAVDNVRCNMKRLNPIFPRNTDQQYALPALYMFRKGGQQLTSYDSHLVALESINEVLEEYEDGPFLCGDFVSAADCYWAPYLERYTAQLPLTQPDIAMNPRYSGEYEAITEWFNAMEEQIPCYTCRVGGDAKSWENVLHEAVANGLVPKIELKVVPPAALSSSLVPNTRIGSDTAQKLWDKYRQTRPYLCQTPHEECVAHIVRNREAIIDKLLSLTNNTPQQRLPRLGGSLTRQDMDDALRETVFALLGKMEASKLSGNARDVAALLNEQLVAPRDMGILPIATIRNLVAAAPKPRIQAN